MTDRSSRHRAACALRRLAPTLLGAALLGVPASSLAVQRVTRVFDETRGLTTSETSTLAQDSLGFVWIGTVGGLYRFDGREMRHWAPDSLRHVSRFITCGAGGEVVTGEFREPLYAITPGGVRAVLAPDGEALRDWRHAAFAHDGALWVLREHALARRDAQGQWREWPTDSLGRTYHVYAARGAGIFLATARALYDVGVDGAPHLLSPLPLVQGVVAEGDSAWTALTWSGELWHLGMGGASLRMRSPQHGATLAMRGTALWVFFESNLLELRPGAPPDTVAPRPGFPTGRVLLVDREGSLWVGGLTGLIQCPEPETVTWTDADGLPSPGHARTCARALGGVWVGTWQGMSLLEPHGAVWRVHIIDRTDRWTAAPDAFGHVWTGGHVGLHDRAGGRDRVFACDLAGDTLMRISGFDPRPDSTLWLATSAGLYVTPRGAGAPRLIVGPPPPTFGTRWRDIFVAEAVEDAHGRLWLTDGDHLAWGAADSIARDLPVAWGEDSIPDAENLSDLEVMPSGALWIGTGNGGVWRFVNGHAEPLAGSRTLGSQRAATLSPSPKGGEWVIGPGMLVRVAEHPELPDGWRRVEELSTWEGVPHQSTGQIFEEQDGTVWIASLAGLTRVPPVARFVPHRAPAVRLVDVLVDGQRRRVDEALRLPFKRNRVELHFAAMSFRDPQLVRYQSRLSPRAPWVDSRDPDFRFVDLHPGRYRAEVRASLDGLDWSGATTAVEFEVLSPWYLEWWALLLMALALAAVLVAAYRIRVGYLLGLERQRVRIAMDLHDEMGAGLGSIGLLAGVAAGSDVDAGEGRRLASSIAEAAGELGGTLSDIVWSLRDDAGTLASLAARLAERGRRLFPEDATQFETRFPAEWPAGALPLEVRRNLQFIATEALHNAARHALARRVELGLARDGERWRLWIEDDGRGLPSDAFTHASGNGLRNLAARARAIGASIAWTTPTGGGTRVELEFRLA